MKSIKRGIAMLLAAVLIIPNMPTFAEEPVPIIDFSTLETQQEETPGSDNASEKQQSEETAADSFGAEQTSTDAAPTESVPAESSASTEPIPTESASSEPASPEVSSSEGASGETSSTESSTVENSTESASTESTSTEAASSEPASTEVSSTESASTEVSTETASTETTTETEQITETETDLTELTTETAVSTETEIETEEEKTLLASELEEVFFNTGNKVMRVSNEPLKGDIELSWDEFRFDENGAYTIRIPEQNPFFPYEVQFTYNGETSSKWFMTPEDCVEVGGHPFYVTAEFDGNIVTQMNLNVAGTKVVVYPEAKTFTDDATNNSQVYSLLPLEEKFFMVDLSGFTPAELTMVSVVDVFRGERQITATDKIMWTYGKSNDDYAISMSGDKLDLSYHTYYPDTYDSDDFDQNGSYCHTKWQMITGNDDQLDTSNIRYLINTKVTKSQKWLDVTTYVQDSNGKRNNVKVNDLSYYDYDRSRRYLQFNVSGNAMGEETQAYISLKVNSEDFAQIKYSDMKVYEGKFTTAEEVANGVDITSQILSTNMTQADAGYMISAGNNQWVTIVTYDAGGNVTGCLPFELRLYKGSNYISRNSLYQRNGTNRNYIEDTSSNKDGVLTIILYKGYAANGKYCLNLDYEKDGTTTNTDVTAAYIGKYESIAEARAANAQDVKDFLFSDDYVTGGYEADFSKGITFSIFVGEDGTETQEKYIQTYKTVEGTREQNSNGGTTLWFKGLRSKNTEEIDSYSVEYNEDSYAEYNYLTMIVSADVDLTDVAPEFGTAEGVKLYSPGSSSPEISGESFHDFSKGPVHYTTASENGENQRNYWLQIVKAESGTGNLYVNSLKDEDSNTKTENGVVYSKREMVIDSYHGSIHDILFINMSTSPLKELSAELSSNVLEMDEYWTLKGKFELSGFTTTERKFPGAVEEAKYGELSNMAKIRLRVKEGVSQDSNISGTLTIKSGLSTLMVLDLTGTIGDPHITTTEIPQAVKYVPYGAMIQNNNKYSWNHVTYNVTGGNLPDGMIVKPNGELYGVPKQSGTFTFEVTMTNSYYKFGDSKKTFTLEVLENTDKNVDAATDAGYTVLQRIPNIPRSNTQDRLFVSEGVFNEFVDVYLDGNKLTKGVDYDAESGSTRITIKAETLDEDLGKGTHTLGVEFRVDGDENKELKRAAQNFKVKSGKAKDDQNNDNDQDQNNDDSGSDRGDRRDSSSNSSALAPVPVTNVVQPDANTVIPNTDAANAIVNPTENAEVISYTIEPGDTLWSIAVKFYGNGNYWRKIYEDNADTISNPDRIFAGQAILIYPLQDALSAPLTNPNAANTAQLPQADNTAADSTDINSYVVQPGDNLWKIARKLYGRGWRWRTIYEANTDTLPDPGQLHVGQVLVIPN